MDNRGTGDWELRRENTCVALGHLTGGSPKPLVLLFSFGRLQALRFFRTGGEMKRLLLTAATGALIIAGCGSPTSKSKEAPGTLSNTPLAELSPPTATRVPKTKSQSNGDGSSFILFETGQVRPIALSPNGRLLLAANTPGNRLEVFALGDGAVQRKRGYQASTRQFPRTHQRGIGRSGPRTDRGGGPLGH